MDSGVRSRSRATWCHSHQGRLSEVGHLGERGPTSLSRGAAWPYPTGGSQASQQGRAAVGCRRERGFPAGPERSSRGSSRRSTKGRWARSSTLCRTKAEASSTIMTSSTFVCPVYPISATTSRSLAGCESSRSFNSAAPPPPDTPRMGGQACAVGVRNTHELAFATRVIDLLHDGRPDESLGGIGRRARLPLGCP